MDLDASPFVCMDCGSRAQAEEPCPRCHEPRLDLRKSAVKLACLDDDDRRKSKREQQLLWAGIPIGLGLVVGAQTLLGEYAALVPGLQGVVGYIVWGIAFSFVAWKALGRAFPAERRFPYLAAHLLAAPLSPPHDTSDYRMLATPKEPPPDAPHPFEPAAHHGAWLTGSYVALIALSAACAIAVVLIGREPVGDVTVHVRAPLLVLLLAAACVAYVVAVGLGLAWVNVSWKAVPEQFRHAKDGRYITPYDATVNMLIPVYNVYWLFYMHGALCDAVTTQLTRLGSRRRAPKMLGMITSAIHLVPYVNLALAPFFWIAYMLAADAAKGEMLGLLRDEQNKRAAKQPALAA